MTSMGSQRSQEGVRRILQKISTHYPSPENESHKCGINTIIHQVIGNDSSYLVTATFFVQVLLIVNFKPKVKIIGSEVTANSYENNNVSVPLFIEYYNVLVP